MKAKNSVAEGKTLVKMQRKTKEQNSLCPKKSKSMLCSSRYFKRRSSK